MNDILFEDLYTYTNKYYKDVAARSARPITKTLADIAKNSPEEYNKQTDDITMINEVTIDGRLFRAYENEFKMSVKQMKKAIDYIKKDDKKCMAEVLGVIFQEVSKTKEENWLESNINERIELFRKNMTADVASPYFLLLIKKAINK